MTNVEQIGDQLSGEILEAAQLIVSTLAVQSNAELDEDDRLAIETGIHAGMSAAMVVLHRHGMIVPGDLGDAP